MRCALFICLVQSDLEDAGDASAPNAVAPPDA